MFHSCSVGSWNENPEAPKEWLKRHRHAWFFLEMPGKSTAYSPKWCHGRIRKESPQTNPSILVISIPGTPKVLTFFLLFQSFGPCALKASTGVQPTKHAAAGTAHAKLTAARDTDSVRRS